MSNHRYAKRVSFADQLASSFLYICGMPVMFLGFIKFQTIMYYVTSIFGG